MAYVRWSGESDVYVYDSVYGYWQVHVAGRGDLDNGFMSCEETATYLEHLRQEGFKVPQYPIDALREEGAHYEDRDGERYFVDKDGNEENVQWSL